MKPIDERRIDPPTNDLVALLHRATRRANAGLRRGLVKQNSDSWRRWVRTQQENPEGQRVLRGEHAGRKATFVKVAWWTDPVGRRHWRVIGKRFDDKDDWTRYSPFAVYPIWHVYPERLTLVHRGGRDELGAHCACGVAGPLASLGWVGESCGPCHDRREEGLPPLPVHQMPLTLARHTAPVTRLAFADGRRLVSGGTDGRIVAWDLDSGEGQVILRRAAGSWLHLAASATGLVVETTAMSNKVLLANLNGDPKAWRTLPLPTTYVYDLAFVPDGTVIAVNSDHGLLLLDPVAEDGASRVLLPADGERDRSAITFSGDRWTAVLNRYHEGIDRLDLRTGERTQLRPHFDHGYDDLEMTELEMESHGIEGGRIAASADGQWIAAIGYWDDFNGVHLYHVARKKWWPIRPARPCLSARAVHFTPQGDLLFVHGTCTVERWSPATRKPLDAISLPIEPGHLGCAFSPDGTQLATTDPNGTIRVWPWRELLAD